jgi:HPt (histidine-containing phosphotransfer) domain-containing protein
MVEARATAPVDESVLLQVTCDCPDLAAELVETFLEELPGEWARLANAVVRRDAAGVRESAHKLAGSLGLMGARRAVQLSRVLEHMGRDGRLDDVESAWRALAACLDEVRPALADWRDRLRCGGA